MYVVDMKNVLMQRTSTTGYIDRQLGKERPKEKQLFILRKLNINQS